MTAAVVDGSEPSAADRLRYGLAMSAVVGVGYVLVLLRNRRFFYQDDAESYYLPLWLETGRTLREGSLPRLSTERWMAGNWAIEPQVGLWNPVQLAINLIIPSFDQLALSAAVVGCGHGLLLAWGVFRTALAYGARAPWAAAAGAAAPFAGFTLYYDSASWMIGLICSSYVAHAWASGVRYTRGASGPLPTFLFLYLTLSTGYAYGAVAAALVLAALMVGELWRRPPWPSLARLAAVGVAAGACGAVTFLPALLSSAVTFRADSPELIANTNFLVISWYEALLASLPTHLPAIDGFGGEVERTPSTYVAWFLLPALAFVAWDRLRADARALAGPLTVLGAMLLYTSGPSTLGPLRWPGRLLPYVSMALLVLAATALSRSGTVRLLPRRSAVALAIVVVCVLQATAITPDRLGDHVASGLLMAVLGGAVVLVWRHWTERAAAGLLLVSVLPVLALQVSQFPQNRNVMQWNFPSSVHKAQEAFPQYTGSTLQLADPDYADPDPNLLPIADRRLDGAWRELAFGNYPLVLDRGYVNGYTAVGHRQLAKTLCMAEVAWTCPEAYRRLFSIEPSTGRSYADLMALDRVVLQRSQYLAAEEIPPPDGWRRANVTARVVVLERVGPTQGSGGGVVMSPGVSVDGVDSLGARLTAKVASPEGGRIVLSRLAWPGYTATLDGRPLAVSEVDEIFLAVDVPAGSAGDLAVEYHPPGRRLGGALVLLGGLVVAGLVVEGRRRRQAPRRTRTQSGTVAPEPRTAPGPDALMTDAASRGFPRPGPRAPGATSRRWPPV